MVYDFGLQRYRGVKKSQTRTPLKNKYALSIKNKRSLKIKFTDPFSDPLLKKDMSGYFIKIKV